MAANKDSLYGVLYRPRAPLDTNGAERDDCLGTMEACAKLVAHQEIIARSGRSGGPDGTAFSDRFPYCDTSDSRLRS
ncbi:MAG: hypothetical protein OXC26_10015 [Albidovulum sp.]|nr:hypothetical protein [Albidovulum sp.]